MGAQILQQSEDLVDPDPFTIAQTFFGAASLILQLVQLRGQNSSLPPAPSEAADLGNLENYMSQCEQKGKQLLRTIEHNVADPDSNFYGRPFRVGSSMMMQPAGHSQFKVHLAEFMTVISNSGLWINHVIENDPALAGRLGMRLHSSLGEIADRLNAILEQGLPNREAIQAAKEILSALGDAIETEYRSQN